MPRLSKEQLAFFEENGYLKISGLFAPNEIQQINLEYDNIFTSNVTGKLNENWSLDVKNEKKIYNIQFHNSLFSDILYKKDYLDVIEDLIKSKNILLHHTEARFKQAGSEIIYPMVQDVHLYPVSNHTMLGTYICLDKETPENGGFCVYPGSHKLGPVEDKGQKEKGKGYHYVDQKKFNYSKSTAITAEQGDLIIFSYLVVRGTHPSLSAKKSFWAYFYTAEDNPEKEVDLALGQGWVMRGRNDKMGADIKKRHLK